jgi:hypothetical protein
VSSKLRNLLKLPKAHKWCYYEWFYSDVDQPLLERENDFCRCLSEMFPDLKTHRLTRVQWRYLRRLMGKPRRCSPTFFSEERALLEHRRRRVRSLQQQIHQGMICGPDFAAYKDVPDYIPQLLVVGTPVTARLHTERESGFYTGRIEAVDLDHHQYWVTFDRPGLGKHSIPDTEIKAASPPEYICVSKLESSHQAHWHHHALSNKDHQRTTPVSTTTATTTPHSSSTTTTLHPQTPPRPILADSTSNVQIVLSPELLPDPFLTSSPERRKLLSEPQRLPGSSVPSKPAIPERVGGFPVDFLRQVMQLSKLLSLKQQVTRTLSQMNTEAEKAHARQKPLGTDFQRQYAVLVVDLDDINKQLNQRLDAIRGHCDSMGYGSEINPPHMNTRDQASRITESANNSLEASGSEVKDPRVIALITKLTGLLLQIEALSESANSLQVNTLSQSVEEISHCIQPVNRSHFRDNVETPVTFVQSGMSPVGTLHAFSAMRPAHHRPFTSSSRTSNTT